MATEKKESKDNKNIKLIMSKIRVPRTIDYLCNLTKLKPSETRRLIARIRKKHPIFAFRDGTGYKFASKKEALKLIQFENNLINNHKKNLEILRNYVGVRYGTEENV